MLEIVAVNVLIIGAGGREYSIGMALKKDEKVDALYFAPGNGATDELGTNLDIGINNSSFPSTIVRLDVRYFFICRNNSFS